MNAARLTATCSRSGRRYGLGCFRTAELAARVAFDLRCDFHDFRILEREDAGDGPVLEDYGDDDPEPERVPARGVSPSRFRAQLEDVRAQFHRETSPALWRGLLSELYGKPDVDVNPAPSL